MFKVLLEFIRPGKKSEACTFLFQATSSMERYSSWLMWHASTGNSPAKTTQIIPRSIKTKDRFAFSIELLA
jgi:hypothetical protein